MKYSKNKCKCISNKKIVGLGKESDKHLYCHECKNSLFPWERQTSICGGCQKIKNMEKIGVF